MAKKTSKKTGAKVDVKKIVVKKATSKLKRGNKIEKVEKIDVKKKMSESKKAAKFEKTLKVTNVDGKKQKETSKAVKDTAPAVRTKSRTDKSKMPSILMSKAYQELVGHMDNEERKLNIPRIDLFVGGHVENAISTGVLALDFTMGGGYSGGRFYQSPGREGSGKTSSVITTIANATAQNVPSLVFDAESAFDASYADRALRRFGYSMAKMQGVYDDQKKCWVEFPMVRVRQVNNLEQVFRYMRRTMKAMPIIRRDHNNDYWAVEQILNKNGSLKSESAVENSGVPQMMFFIDSLAALVPNILDSDDEKATIGAQALAYSRMLPGVCSLTTNRNCILVGTNQLRDQIGGFSRPGMPTPTTQPGGNAVKYYCDVRTFINKCSPSTAGWTKSDTEYTEEPSIYGGSDRYIFTKFKNNKNKVYEALREGYARIRYRHNSKPGDGYCAAYDVYQMLAGTGQASKRGTTLSLDIQPSKENGKLPSLPVELQSKKMSWMDFKRAVELPENKQAMFNHCRAQIKSGYAFDLERERVTNKKTTVVGSDEDE